MTRSQTRKSLEGYGPNAGNGTSLDGTPWSERLSSVEGPVSVLYDYFTQYHGIKWPDEPAFLPNKRMMEKLQDLKLHSLSLLSHSFVPWDKDCQVIKQISTFRRGRELKISSGSFTQKSRQNDDTQKIRSAKIIDGGLIENHLSRQIPKTTAIHLIYKPSTRKMIKDFVSV